MMEKIKERLSDWFAEPPYGGWWWVALVVVLFAQGLSDIMRGALLAGMLAWGAKILNTVNHKKRGPYSRIVEAENRLWEAEREVEDAKKELERERVYRERIEAREAEVEKEGGAS